MASVDGEPHEVIVLVAVCAGAILASIILIILIAMIERTKKNQPISSSLSDASISKISSSNSFHLQPSTSNQGISTISDRVSMSSEKSYCSGVLINGQMRCCQKALEVVGKNTSQISISSGISSISDVTNVSERSREHVPKVSFELGQIVVEREFKMANPKVIQGMEQSEETLDRVVTKL